MKRAPPWWAMPAAAGLVLLLLGAGLPAFLRAQEDGRKQWAVRAERAIGKRQPAEPGQRRPLSIIGVGTSMLLCATLHDRDLDAFSVREKMRPLHYRAICCGGSKWDPMPALEAAAAARPDVLVVDSKLLTAAGRGGFDDEGPGAYVRWLRFSLDAWLDSDSLRKVDWAWPVRVLPPPSKTPVKVTLTPRFVADRRADRDASYQPEKCLRYADVLKRAMESGVYVVVLDLMMTPPQMAYAPEMARRIADMEDALSAASGAPLWRCPETFVEDDFFDTGHLGPSGREKVSRWLVHKLDELEIP